MVVVVGSGNPETLMDSMNEFGRLSTKHETSPFTRRDSRLTKEEPSENVNADRVTNQVLKICNVVRQRLDVHSNDDYVKKRSGLGGTGGHLLSPDLRVRFGTFGFTRPQ